MSREIPIWRSLLYVPANNERFVSGAARHGADAIILDLEDSIPASAKSAARESLLTAVPLLRSQGLDVLVRVNSGEPLATDISAAIAAGADVIDLPKVGSVDYLAHASDLIARAEDECGRAPGSVRLKLLLETPEAFLKLQAIADHVRSNRRIVAMTVGNEDLSAELNIPADSPSITFFYQHMVMAAGYAGVMPLGLPGDVGDFRDLGRLRAQAQTGRALGLQGSSCVHPSHIATLNDIFGTSAEELRKAKDIIESAGRHASEHIGAFVLDGRMIDEPMVKRAERLVARARLSDRTPITVSGTRNAG